jgi:serine/threonine-protein kinase
MGSTESAKIAGRPRAFVLGDIVDGRYELRSDLGRGAGGVVFEACHCFTGRTVALKIVAPEVSRVQLAEFRARLVREARALAAARHPSIVEVLDGGVLADGTPYFVMEKLEGRTLEGLLAARRKISPEEVVALALQLCDALECAHKLGIVHRDLKPANVFVVRERDGFERAKLVDFGTAQVAAEQEGAPEGSTPAADGDIDTVADIQALGMTLVECLPELDGPLAPILHRATATRRSERFPNMLEFARALHAAIPAERRATSLLGPPPASRFASSGPVGEDPRRKMPRAPYVTPVNLLLKGGAIDGRTEDISEGGLLVITRHPCEPGQRATIRFASPIEGKVVSCEVHLRWVRAARPEMAQGARAIGVEFIDPAAEVRASIARYVAAMGEATGV